MSWLYQIAIEGVNHSLPGNGGEECVLYIPHWQKLFETLIFVWLAYQGMYISFTGLGVQNVALERRRSLSSHGNMSPVDNANYGDDNDADDDVISLGPNQLRVDKLRPMIFELCATLKKPFSDCLIFYTYLGVFVSELIYKVVTKTAIFLFNPCHVSTILQLILLKMSPLSPLAMRLFRFHLYMVPGALLAVLFPILNTRLVLITNINYIGLMHSYPQFLLARFSFPVESTGCQGNTKQSLK